MEKESYDFIIIGAGVTGMAAAMYGARLGLKTVCFGTSSSAEMPIGGVITTTNVVENYPGFIRLTGTELADKIRDHALSYDLVSIRDEKVVAIEKKKIGFMVKTGSGVYEGRALLFATGTTWRKLEVKGSKGFENRGVAYCALCDAPMFKKKIVAVVGGSDSAAKDALVLAEHAAAVYIIYRGKKLRAEPVTMKRVEQSKKITVITETNVVEVRGEKLVNSVVLDRAYEGSRELALQGLFVAIGHIPLSALAMKLGVDTNEKGEIVLDHKTSSTSVPGVFAAGDVADKPFKQAITGVAEGCTAAYSAYEYITKSSL
ncbi:MAG TPA: FAD-dependent oxidoreductase [Candidatus Nanoarchaeia archaeon]|nr:FAD-dependent oxidoreductase [Candidatus Nanoarchaeia archaeon]